MRPSRPPSDEHLDGTLLAITIMAVLALLWVLMLMG